MKKVHYLLSLQCALQLAFSGSVLAQTVSAPVQTTQTKTTSSAPVPINLDLTSTAKTVMAGNLASKAVNINVGGKTLQVTNSTLLTPAERLAVYQVWSTGNQTLQLGALGNATGGTFTMGSRFNQYVSSLVVPHGVTGIQNASSLSSLNLTGNLTNAGNLYAVSTNTSITSAGINAANILNQKGGLISTMLPGSGLPGMSGALGSLNLSLSAVNNIVNSGIISSSGNLSLTAGNSITNALPTGVTGAAPIMQAAGSLNLATNQLINAGLINAVSGNINLVGVNNSSIMVNNSKGILQALSGNLNVRDALFSEKSNFTLTGGQLLAQQTNIFSGDGIVSLDAEKISGLLNIKGGEAHVLVNTGDLNLGTMDLSGDPNIYVTSGSLTLNSDLSYSGQNLALVAAGDITAATAGIKIDTSSSSGDGGAITLVAGASFTVGTPGPSGQLTITKGSATGGKIDLATNAIAQFDSSSSVGNGGAVNLVAFKGTATGSGSIFVQPKVDIKTSGAATFSNGDVTVIAGGYSYIPQSTGSTTYIPVAVSLGGINASGAGKGGNITITAATPTIVSPVVITDGKITSGSFGTGAATPAAITVGSLTVGSPPTYHGITSDGDLSMSGGWNISTLGPVTAKGKITETSTANNGGIFVDANMVAQGPINLTAHGTGGVFTLSQMISNPSTQLFTFGTALSPDGKYAYVPNYTSNTVSVIDTSNNATITNITVDTVPKGIVVSPDNSTVYVVCNSATLGQGTIDVIDTSSRTVSSKITIAATGSLINFDPQLIAVAADGKHLYVLSDYAANIGSSTATTPSQLTIIDTADPSLGNQTNITLTGGFGQPINLGGLVLNPSGTFAYIANAGSNNISVVNLATKTLSTTIALPGTSTEGWRAVGLGFDPTGSRLYVGQWNGTSVSGKVVLVDTLSTSSTYNKLLSPTTPSYSNFLPQSLAVTPTGTQLIVNPTYTELVAILNPNNFAVNELPGMPTGSVAPDGYGSSTLCGIVTNSGVRNVQTYVGCPTHSPYTTTGTVAVLQTPTIQSTAISLRSSGGNIIANYDAQGGTFTASTSGSGYVMAGNVGTASSTVNASSAGGLFQIGSMGSLNINGTISSPQVILQTTANNAGINVNGSVGLSTGTVNMFTNGTGAITQGASGKILAKTATIGSDSGDIGSSGTPLQTALSNVSILTTGGAWLSNSNALTLNTSSTGTTLSLANKGTVTVPTSATITAGTKMTLGGTGFTTSSSSLLDSPEITITANTGSNGGITLNGQVGKVGNAKVAGSKVNLTADGSGSITQGSGTYQIEAESITLGASSGSIGTSTVPIRTTTGTLDVFTTGLTGAFLKNTGDVTLYGTSGGSFILNNTGDIKVAGVTNATTITLNSTGNIDIQGGIGFVPSLLTSALCTTKITATGNITDTLQDQYDQIRGNSVTLQAANIGTSAQIVQVSAVNLALNTPGDAYLSGVDSTGYGLSLTLNASSVGGTFRLYCDGVINVKGAITAPNVELDVYSGNSSNINVAANIGIAGKGYTTLITDTGSITQSAGTILSSALLLGSNGGSIGTSALPMKAACDAFVTGTAVPTNVYLNNSKAINISVTVDGTGSVKSVNVKNTFQVVAAGNLTVDSLTPIIATDGKNAGQVVLKTSTGNINLNDTITAGATSGTAVTISAGGSGNIIAAGSAAITAPSVLLQSGTGSVGTALNPIIVGGTSGSNIAALTTGSGNVFLKLSSAATLLNSAAGTTGGQFNVQGLAAPGAAITVASGSSIKASTIEIDNNAAITVNGALAGTNVKLNSTAGPIALNANIGASGSTSADIQVGDASNITLSGTSAITAATVTLASNGGSIGTDGTHRLATVTGKLSANTSGVGNIYLKNTGSLNLLSANAGGAFDLVNSAALTSGAPITAGSVTLQSSGNMSLAGITAAGGVVALTATSGGNITSSAIVQCNSLTLSSLGSIGTTLVEFTTNAPSLTATATNSAYLHDYSPSSVSLGASSAGSTFQLKFASNLTTSTLTAANIQLLADAVSGAGITIGGNMGKTGAVVALSADGTGSIGGAGIVTGTSLVANNNTGTGNINLTTSMTNLTLLTAATGNVSVTNALATNLLGTAGASVSVTSKGALTVSGTLQGDDISLTTSNASAGNIIVSGNIGQPGTTKVTITAAGTGTITQSKSTFAITGTTVNLAGTSGSIGTGTMPIATVASKENIKTGGTSTQANVSNTGAVTLISASSAPNFNLTSSDGINLAAGATVTGSASLTLKATASAAAITQADGTGTTTLFSPKVVLSAGSLGTIGSGANNLTLAAAPTGTSAQTVNLTAGAGTVSIYSNNSAAGSFVVNTVLSGSSSSGAGNFSLASTGNVSFSSSSQIKSGGTVTVQSGAGASITQATSGATVVVAPVVILQTDAGSTGTGSVGTQTVSIGVNSGAAGKSVALTVNAGKDAFVAGTTSNSVPGAVDLTGASNVDTATGKFVLTSTGNLKLAGGATVQAGNSISLSTSGTSISQTDASTTTTLFAPTITLTATGTGAQIGASGNSIAFAQDKTTAAQNVVLTAKAPGAVYLNGVNSTMVATVAANLAGASSAGTSAGFALAASGDININSGAKVSVTGGTINLIAGKNINQIVAGTTLTAPTVNLVAGSSENIGSNLISIGVAGATLVTVNSGNDAYVAAGGAATLGNSTVGSNLNLIASGAITTTGSQTVGAGMLLKSTSSGVITLGSNISATTATLYTGGAIAQSGSTQLSAGTISFTGPTAAGPTSVGASGKSLITATKNFNLPTAGQVWISNVGDLNLPAKAFSGTAFSLDTKGALATNAAISAGTIRLASTSSGADLTLGADVGSSTSSVVLSVDAGGGGKISQTAGVVKGTNLTASGGSGSINLSTVVTNLTLNAPGTANIANAAATTIQGTSGGTITVFSTGALTIKGAANGTAVDLSTTTSGVGITVSAPVNAATVSLKTIGGGAIAIGNNVGQAGGDTTINASGTGNLTFTGAFNVLGKNVTLTAGGNIGTPTAAVKTQADNLTLTAGSSGTVANSLTNDFTIKTATTGGALSVSDSGGSLAVATSITVSSNTPTNLKMTSNNLTLTETGTAGPGGAIAINGNLNVYGGKIVIQTTNTTSGQISFGTGAKVNTLVDHTTPTTNGTITVAVGPLPTTKQNGGQAFFPANVTVTTTAPGQAYAGAFPGALVGPSLPANAALVNAAGRDVVFSSTSNSRTITLGDNVSITADPPGAGAVASSLGSGLAVAEGAGRFAGNPHLPMQSISVREPLSTSIPVLSTQRLVGPISTDQLPGRTVVAPASVGAAANSAAGATGQSNVVAAGTTPYSGAVQTNIVRGATDRSRKDILLDERSMLLTPEEPVTVKTSCGDVTVEQGAVAYVVESGGTLAVYNLHDSHAGDVTVMIGGNKHKLSPGEHMLVTNEFAGGYEQLNPVDSIAHRNMQSGTLPGTQRFFSSRFSLASAISGLKEIAALRDSSNARERRIYRALIKNAAILLQTQAGGGAYARVTNAAKLVRD